MAVGHEPDVSGWSSVVDKSHGQRHAGDACGQRVASVLSRQNNGECGKAGEHEGNGLNAHYSARGQSGIFHVGICQDRAFDV